MIKKEWISPKGNKKTTRVGRVDAIKAGREEGGGETVGDTPIWLLDWSGAAREDYEYRAVRKVVEKEERRFKPELRLKVLITEYELSLSGKLLYRGRLWVLSGRNLRARVL